MNANAYSSTHVPASAPIVTQSRDSFQRVSRSHPCRRCKHTDGCEYGENPPRDHCIRDESGVKMTGRLGGSLFYEQDWRENSSLSAVASAIVHAAPIPLPKACPATLDEVYQAVLALCPLSPDDRGFLLKSGLLECELTGYGTLPPRAKQDPILAALIQRFDEQLREVPGFVVDKQNAVRFPLQAGGLLNSVIGLDGRIRGLSCRQVMKDGKKRYVWLSGAGGASVGSPAHVVQPEGSPADTWVVTEGRRKADIAARHLNLPTIGLIGHGVQADGLDVLAQLAERGASRVIIAFDEDANPETRKLVDASRRKFAEAALLLGMAVRLARWDGAKGKGIDDLLLAGHQPTIETVTARLLDDADDGADEGDPGPSGRGAHITQAQKAVRYDQLDNLFWCRNMSDPSNPERAMLQGQKLSLWGTWRIGGFPGEPEPPGPRSFPVSVVATCLCMSRQTLTENLKSLSSVGLISHDVKRNAGGDTVVSVATLRNLKRNEVLPKPERAERIRVEAAARKCRECGSELVKVETKLMERISCTSCGSIGDWEDPPAKDEASTARPGLKFTPKIGYEKRERARRDAQWQADQQELREDAQNHIENFNGAAEGDSATGPQTDQGASPRDGDPTHIENSNICKGQGAPESGERCAPLMRKIPIEIFNVGQDGRPLEPCPDCGLRCWGDVGTGVFCGNCGFEPEMGQEVLCYATA